MDTVTEVLGWIACFYKSPAVLIGSYRIEEKTILTVQEKCNGSYKISNFVRQLLEDSGNQLKTFDDDDM